VGGPEEEEEEGGIGGFRCQTVQQKSNKCTLDSRKGGELYMRVLGGHLRGRGKKERKGEGPEKREKILIFKPRE